jgi:hypothetical protein
MSTWESIGASDEWYTPAHVFDALGVTFDLDVSAPPEGPRHVPTSAFLHEASLTAQWRGFIWMNPPFGGRNGLVPWLDTFFAHGDGIALTPDRTSAPWWQDAADRADALLLTRGRIKFERPDGTTGNSPGAGVTLFAAGKRGAAALMAAQKAGLGSTWVRAK